MGRSRERNNNKEFVEAMRRILSSANDAPDEFLAGSEESSAKLHQLHPDSEIAHGPIKKKQNRKQIQPTRRPPEQPP
jgi:hypothetical protein